MFITPFLWSRVNSSFLGVTTLERQIPKEDKLQILNRKIYRYKKYTGYKHQIIKSKKIKGEIPKKILIHNK